jgi:hypothetical protein
MRMRYETSQMKAIFWIVTTPHCVRFARFDYIIAQKKLIGNELVFDVI